MITAAPFLDPRGTPKDGRMPFIGGPLDGQWWSMYIPLNNDDIEATHGGRYVYADQREWAFVWMPSR